MNIKLDFNEGASRVVISDVEGAPVTVESGIELLVENYESGKDEPSGYAYVTMKAYEAECLARAILAAVEKSRASNIDFLRTHTPDGVEKN